MTPLQIILGSFQILVAVLLTAAVAFQSSPDSSGMGALTGESGGFFGRSKSKTLDKKLSKATIILGIIFVILTVSLGLAA